MQTLEGTVRRLLAERKFPVVAELIEHYWKDEPENPFLAIWLPAPDRAFLSIEPAAQINMSRKDSIIE